MTRSIALLTLACFLLANPAAQADFLKDYVHTYTGFTFPPKIAAFDRTKVTPFNPERSDIEVDYDNSPYTVRASVYVYPATAPLKTHYEECREGVVRVHPDAKLLNESQLTFDKAGTTYHGFAALFSFRDKFVGEKPQNLLSKLIVFRRDDYYILYRISYASSDRADAERQIADFLARLAWPSGGKDSSGVE
jgi:hypothetical protein